MALRSPGTNTWLSVHAQGQQPVPCYCFLIPRWLPAGIEPYPTPTCTPTTVANKASNLCHRGPFALEINQAGPKQAVPTPAPEVSRLPQPQSHKVKRKKTAGLPVLGGFEPLPTPPPVPSEPVYWEEITLASPNLNGEGRRGGGESQQEAYYASAFNSLLHETAHTALRWLMESQKWTESLRVTSGTQGLRIWRLWSLGATSKQRRLEMSGANLPRPGYSLKHALYSKQWYNSRSHPSSLPQPDQ